VRQQCASATATLRLLALERKVYCSSLPQSLTRCDASERELTSQFIERLLHAIVRLVFQAQR
jgi:hypothetical protein